MQFDQENLKRKNEELIQAFREKSRKQLQTQELYDKLKQRAMLNQVQNAASDAVDHSIQASGEVNRIADRIDGQYQRPPQPPLFSSIQDSGAELQHPSSNSAINIGRIIGRSGTGDWAGFRNSQESVTRTSRRGAA
jgi:E3 ubiquitin-protein ligase CCNP1IP1